MKASLPEKKLMLPMNLNPASRSIRGGSDTCKHHYADSSKRVTVKWVEWTCSNCDRLVCFEKMQGYNEKE